jgi:hypothetical protein
MRALKIAVVVMGVLIVTGTAGLVVAVLRRPAGFAGGFPPVIQAVLQEPAGTRIGGIAAVQDRLAVSLSGGGPDRVVLVDPRSGAVTGRVALAH